MLNDPFASSLDQAIRNLGASLVNQIKSSAIPSIGTMPSMNFGQQFYGSYGNPMGIPTQNPYQSYGIPNQTMNMGLQNPYGMSMGYPMTQQPIYNNPNYNNQNYQNPYGGTSGFVPYSYPQPNQQLPVQIQQRQATTPNLNYYGPTGNIPAANMGSSSPNELGWGF